MHKIKVLYVEDEPFLGKVVKESLESRQFEVLMIQDGKDVVAGFETYAPNIVVLDIMLPNTDGYSLAKAIRQRNAQVPIIFVSAKTQTNDLIKAFDLGGNDYLRKPFSIEELIVRINNLLHLTQTQVFTKQESIPIGKFDFSPLQYELRMGASIRKLSHREANVLHIFAQHQNKNIERKTIMMHVWGDDSFFNSRNLDVYITKLREYLRPDPSIQIITIKGVGYRFVVG